MTPRQRRGVLLLFVAGIGAILVFSLISGYVSDVRKDVEPKTGVLVLTRAVPELQPIPPDAVAMKSVPAKWVGRQALRDPSQIGSLVPNEPLPAGVELQQGMLVEPPALDGRCRIACIHTELSPLAASALVRLAASVAPAAPCPWCGEPHAALPCALCGHDRNRALTRQEMAV